MTDLDVISSNTLRYSSKCFGNEPSLFICSTDQPYLNLDNELKKIKTVDLHKTFPLTLKRCFNWNCSDERIKFLCDCTFNMKKLNSNRRKKCKPEHQNFHERRALERLSVQGKRFHSNVNVSWWLLRRSYDY